MKNKEIIFTYLDTRKELFLKKEIKEQKKTGKSDETIAIEADNKFDFKTWVLSAASRARHFSIVTHNCKYGHSLAKTTSVYYKPERDKSHHGLLISGLVDVEEDAYGSAGSMDVYGFLKMILSDGRTLLEHLVDSTDEMKQLFSFDDTSYDEVRSGFLSMIYKDDVEDFTDTLVKQVIFPVEDSYYVFSTLAASGLISEFKTRIDEIRFPKDEAILEAKKKKKAGKYSGMGFKTIPPLTVICYGGSKPQNIGALNKNTAGNAYLLSCEPPSIKEQAQKGPRCSFFDSLRGDKTLKKSLGVLKKLSDLYYSNRDIKGGIKRIIDSILDRILDKVQIIRLMENGWSSGSEYKGLNDLHKQILDDQYQNVRDSKTLTKEFVIEVADWICSQIKHEKSEDSLYHLIISIGTDKFRGEL